MLLPAIDCQHTDWLVGCREIFCAAYKKGVFGAKFQWLVVGMYEAQWWAVPQNGVTCKPSQILQALQGTLVMEIQPISSNNNKVTISGRVSSCSNMCRVQFKGQFNLRNTRCNVEKLPSLKNVVLRQFFRKNISYKQVLKVYMLLGENISS